MLQQLRRLKSNDELEPLIHPPDLSGLIALQEVSRLSQSNQPTQLNQSKGDNDESKQFEHLRQLMESSTVNQPHQTHQIHQIHQTDQTEKSKQTRYHNLEKLVNDDTDEIVKTDETTETDEITEIYTITENKTKTDEYIPPMSLEKYCALQDKKEQEEKIKKLWKDVSFAYEDAKRIAESYYRISDKQKSKQKINRHYKVYSEENIPKSDKDIGINSEETEQMVKKAINLYQTAEKRLADRDIYNVNVSVSVNLSAFQITLSKSP